MTVMVIPCLRMSLSVLPPEQNERQKKKRFEQAGLREGCDRGAACALVPLAWKRYSFAEEVAGARWTGRQSRIPADRRASQPIMEQRAWQWPALRRCCQARATLIRGQSARERGRIGRRWSHVDLASCLNPGIRPIRIDRL